jgi:hypothetical protein
VHYAPVSFEHGMALFARINSGTTMRIKDVAPSTDVTHTTYAVM